MNPVVRLELAKLVAGRSFLYLLLPNLYTLFYTAALGVAVVTRAPWWTEFLGVLVTTSIALHPYVALTAYPMCLLMLCVEQWGAEARDGTLRTTMLTQVPRGTLLAARVVVAAGVVVAGFVLYFALFFAHVAVLERVVSPVAWAKIRFPVGDGLANMVPFAGAFAVGAVTLSLWMTLMALLADRASTVAMLAVSSLAALAYGVPTVESWVREGAPLWSRYGFTHAWVELTGREMLRGVLLGPATWGAMAQAVLVLAVNALGLYAVCAWVLRRREFVD